MGFADEWYLHPLTPEFEREMVAEGIGIDKEEAKELAEKGRLPPHKVVKWCSEDREKKKIFDRFGFEGKKVLEVGCGRGYYTQFLARESMSVCALDKMVGGRENHMWEEFKEVMKGHESWKKVLPIQTDARDITVPDDSFEIATCASFFRDLYPHDVQREIIEEMERVSEELKIAVYVHKDLDKA
ncbi:MAG: class I SAM-dependent methyltransferase, partial [Thermoplasmata archaeon]